MVTLMVKNLSEEPLGINVGGVRGVRVLKPAEPVEFSEDELKSPGFRASLEKGDVTITLPAPDDASNAEEKKKVRDARLKLAREILTRSIDKLIADTRSAQTRAEQACKKVQAARDAYNKALKDAATDFAGTQALLGGAHVVESAQTLVIDTKQASAAVKAKTKAVKDLQEAVAALEKREALDQPGATIAKVFEERAAKQRQLETAKLELVAVDVDKSNAEAVKKADEVKKLLKEIGDLEDPELFKKSGMTLADALGARGQKQRDMEKAGAELVALSGKTADSLPAKVEELRVAMVKLAAFDKAALPAPLAADGGPEE